MFRLIFSNKSECVLYPSKAFPNSVRTLVRVPVFPVGVQQCSYRTCLPAYETCLYEFYKMNSVRPGCWPYTTHICTSWFSGTDLYTRRSVPQTPFPLPQKQKNAYFFQPRNKNTTIKSNNNNLRLYIDCQNAHTTDRTK
jgi:hypothetical protein